MKKADGKNADTLLQKLASASVNDAVKLMFLGEDDTAVIDGLDLTLLSEVKRSANGAVELKFVDRLEVLRELFARSAPAGSDGGDAAGFYAALDRAARQLIAEEKNAV